MSRESIWIIEGRTTSRFDKKWTPIKLFHTRDQARSALEERQFDPNIVRLRVVPYRRSALK